MTDFAPIHAGVILRTAIDMRGWTQAQFAEIIGRPAQSVNEIINGKKEITRETATQISAALGKGPEFWLNVQDSYYLWVLNQSQPHQLKLAVIRANARKRSEPAAK